MAQEHTIADSLRRMALQYADMVAAADIFDSIGSTVDHIAQLHKQRDQAILEKAAADGEVEAAKALVVNTNADIAKIVADAQAHAKAIVDQAHIDSDAVVIKSAQDAQLIVENAHEQIAMVNAAHEDSLLKAQKSLDAINTAIESANVKRVAAEDTANAAQSQLDMIKAEIAKLPKL